MTAHTLLKLTAEQRRVAGPIISAPRWRPGLPERKKTFLELTSSQIQRVRRETGLIVPRVEVRARHEFEENCTCEDVQTAVIYADRVAVLHQFLMQGVVTDGQAVAFKTAYGDPETDYPFRPLRDLERFPRLPDGELGSVEAETRQVLVESLQNRLLEVAEEETAHVETLIESAITILDHSIGSPHNDLLTVSAEWQPAEIYARVPPRSTWELAGLPGHTQETVETPSPPDSGWLWSRDDLEVMKTLPARAELRWPTAAVLRNDAIGQDVEVFLLPSLSSGLFDTLGWSMLLYRDGLLHAAIDLSPGKMEYFPVTALGWDLTGPEPMIDSLLFTWASQMGEFTADGWWWSLR